MTTINDIELATLQSSINQTLYDDIIKYYKTALNKVDNKQALDLVISSVATNLGAILAQIPDLHRDQYITIANSIIKDSISYNIEKLDKVKWGQVGHS